MKNLILAFILICLLSNCSQESDESLPQRFSGEELFGSIFFLRGNAVNKISHLSELREEIEDAIEGEFDESITTIKDDIIKVISENKPSFFENFQTDIQSGNHLRIEKAIKYATKELAISSRFIFDNQIEELVSEIQISGEADLKELFEEDHILKINDLKDDPQLLREFLFNEFIIQTRFNPSGRETCLAVAAALAVVAGGVFDVGISMNVVIGFNYALASYTYVVSSGNTGQTWMFFNAGVINYLANWEGGYTGDKPCGDHPSNPCPIDDDSSNRVSSERSLSFELFVNEIAENLRSHAS